jgi:hypothetical protein
VPAGKALELDLLQGTTVNMSEYIELLLAFTIKLPIDGDVTFGVANWDGPLFTVRYVLCYLCSGEFVLRLWITAAKTLHVCNSTTRLGEIPDLP